MSDTMKRLQEFKKPGKVRVSPFRRVRHSASNKIMAKTGRKGLAVDSTVAAAGMVGTGAALGGVIVPATIAAGAGAVLTGPLFATVVGIAGIITMAYSMCSNREKAHETLTPHVWSYIDTIPPPPLTDKKEVKAAALSLITNGYAQQKLQSGKLNTAMVKFNAWTKKYGELSLYHHELSKYPGNPQKFAIYKPWIVKNDKARIDHLDKGFAKGGAVYEFMRRLVHRANYLQAYTICGKFFQGDNSSLDDFQDDFRGIAETRDFFKRMAKRIDSDNAMSEKCK